MALQQELADTTVADLAYRIRRRDLSPVEVVNATIEAIEADNDRLNAFVYVGFEEARERTKGPASIGDSLYDFDPDRDAGKLHSMDHVYNADSTNMSAFERRGGKLISWQGFADPLITPYGLIQHYEDVVRASGNSLPATERWYRTFFLPGVYHCAGGPGPDQVDWLGVIREWVERGVPPRVVIATKIAPDGSVIAKRPVYPYPLEAAYVGSGSTNDRKLLPHCRSARPCRRRHSVVHH